jgi:hypothetical protein
VSGYSSKAEVVEVVKATIRGLAAPQVEDGLSRDPGDYFISRIVRDNFRSSGSHGYYGWHASTDAETFSRSLYTHLRRR